MANEDTSRYTDQTAFVDFALEVNEQSRTSLYKLVQVLSTAYDVDDGIGIEATTEQKEAGVAAINKVLREKNKTDYIFEDIESADIAHPIREVYLLEHVVRNYGSGRFLDKFLDDVAKQLPLEHPINAKRELFQPDSVHGFLNLKSYTEKFCVDDPRPMADDVRTVHNLWGWEWKQYLKNYTK